MKFSYKVLRPGVIKGEILKYAQRDEPTRSKEVLSRILNYRTGSEVIEFYTREALVAKDVTCIFFAQSVTFQRVI